MNQPAKATPRRPMLRRALHLTGIDRAVAWTVLGRGWGALAGVINVVFIARFLSSSQQGFYYTFISILAAQIFFELGLTQVVLQFTSHERALLAWDEEGCLTGDATAKGRVASLVRWSLRWYAAASLLMAVVLVPLGWMFFSRQASGQSSVDWQWPWVMAALASAAALLLNPFLGTLEGAGRVALVAIIRLTQALGFSLALWGALAAGLGLYAAACATIASLSVGAAWLIVRYRAVFVDLLSYRSGQASLHWRDEVWPFQWRTAATVCSGYFTFYFFAPVLFSYQGAVSAGQMGMSISVALAISAFAIGWMYTKSAPFGVLVAKRRWAELDRAWTRTAVQSTLVCASLCLGALLVLTYLNASGSPLAARFLPLQPFVVLMVAITLSHVWFCESYYLRAHKREPFVWISLASGVLVALSSLVLGRSYGAMGMVVGYAAVVLMVGLGAGTFIFVIKRRAWHQDDDKD